MKLLPIGHQPELGLCDGEEEEEEGDHGRKEDDDQASAGWNTRAPLHHSSS